MKALGEPEPVDKEFQDILFRQDALWPSQVSKVLVELLKQHGKDLPAIHSAMNGMKTLPQIKNRVRHLTLLARSQSEGQVEDALLSHILLNTQTKASASSRKPGRRVVVTREKLEQKLKFLLNILSKFKSRYDTRKESPL